MAYPQGEIRVSGVAERGPHTQHFGANTGLLVTLPPQKHRPLFTELRMPRAGWQGLGR
jgi:hypothetical protein